MNFLVEINGYELCEKDGDYIVVAEKDDLLTISVVKTDSDFIINREIDWKSPRTRWERKIQLRKITIADETMNYFDRYLQDIAS